MADDPVQTGEQNNGESWDRGVEPAHYSGEATTDVWPVVVGALLVAAALLFMSQIARAVSFSGTPFRDRALVVAVEGGGWATSALVLGAVAIDAATHRLRRGLGVRWTIRFAVVMAAVLLASAVYVIGYVLFAHQDTSSGAMGTIFASSWIADLGSRLWGVFAAVASGLIAGVSLFVVRRTASQLRLTDAAP
jgi:hypothetical protein